MLDKINCCRDDDAGRTDRWSLQLLQLAASGEDFTVRPSHSCYLKPRTCDPHSGTERKRLHLVSVDIFYWICEKRCTVTCPRFKPRSDRRPFCVEFGDSGVSWGFSVRVNGVCVLWWTKTCPVCILCLGWMEMDGRTQFHHLHIKILNYESNNCWITNLEDLAPLGMGTSRHLWNCWLQTR